MTDLVSAAPSAVTSQRAISTVQHVWLLRFDGSSLLFRPILIPAMSVQSILNVQRLTKTYATAAGPLTVLQEVSFSIPAGGTCAIVGPSGSGKTTLLGLCAGLDQPSACSVHLDGREIGGMSEDQRALFRNECVGFVFQNFQLIPTLTAQENVLVPLELRGNGVKESNGADLRARVGL